MLSGNSSFSPAWNVIPSSAGTLPVILLIQTSLLFQHPFLPPAPGAKLIPLSSGIPKRVVNNSIRALTLHLVILAVSTRQGGQAAGFLFHVLPVSHTCKFIQQTFIELITLIGHPVQSSPEGLYLYVIFTSGLSSLRQTSPMGTLNRLMFSILPRSGGCQGLGRARHLLQASRSQSGCAPH